MIKFAIQINERLGLTAGLAYLELFGSNGVWEPKWYEKYNVVCTASENSNLFTVEMRKPGNKFRTKAAKLSVLADMKRALEENVRITIEKYFIDGVEITDIDGEKETYREITPT